MDARYYCESMQSELTGMKARIYNIIREIDKMPDSDRQRLWPQIPELYNVMDELSTRLDELKAECPSDWTQQKSEIEAKAEAARKKINYWDAEHIPAGYYSG